MNPIDQQIAIAESQGFTPFKRNEDGSVKSWKGPDGSVWQEPWAPCNYLEDLNAMHEVESKMDLSLHDYYEFWLGEITKTSALALRRSFVGERFMLAHATAAQRAEAYLRTINKWKD